MINENYHLKQRHPMLSFRRTQMEMKFHGDMKVLQNINR